MWVCFCVHMCIYTKVVEWSYLTHGSKNVYVVFDDFPKHLFSSNSTFSYKIILLLIANQCNACIPNHTYLKNYGIITCIHFFYYYAYCFYVLENIVTTGTCIPIDKRWLWVRTVAYAGDVLVTRNLRTSSLLPPITSPVVRNQVLCVGSRTCSSGNVLTI